MLDGSKLNPVNTGELAAGAPLQNLQALLMTFNKLELLRRDRKYGKRLKSHACYHDQKLEAGWIQQ